MKEDVQLERFFITILNIKTEVRCSNMFDYEIWIDETYQCTLQHNVDEDLDHSWVLVKGEASEDFIYHAGEAIWRYYL